MTHFRLALAQTNPARADIVANRDSIAKMLERAAGEGAQLAIFPECALSGYVFQSGEEALPACETGPGASTELFHGLCRRLGIWAVVGFLERADGGAIYNSAAIVGPEGLKHIYRKTHLPVLGVDRFVARGGSLDVIDLPFCRLGILICYDLRFPEVARTLALAGADVVAVPTNWPRGADSSPDFITRARALENRVYIAACNRVGTEEGTTFIGRSQIVSPDGRILAEASPAEPELLVAEIDPAAARMKKMIFEPGVFELDPVGDRRPEIYRL